MWMSKLWRAVRKMFGYTEIKRIIGKDVVLSQNMIDAINDWKKMLTGNADWLTDSIESLRIEHGICREFADVVLSEMESSIDIISIHAPTRGATATLTNFFFYNQSIFC